MIYYLIVFATALITLIPIKFLYVVSEAVTKSFFFFWKKKRANVYKNYSIILEKSLGRKPELKEIKKVADDNFRDYGMFNVEFLYLSKMVKKGVVPELKGMDNINRALENGKGLVICTLHFSNWDIAGLTIAGHYKNVYAIADDLGGGYSRYIQETRGKYGIKVVLPNKNLKDAYKCLNSNGILNVLVDRPLPRSDKSGVEVEFFGRKAYVATAAARLVLKTGAKAIVGSVIRDKNSFYGNPGDIVEFIPSGNHDEDIKNLTQAMLLEAEKIIIKHPEQWYMFRDFWKD
jgi:KDO2-lipid IV(A) lauroyltransferase